jgi:hypothetical protein
MPKVRDIICHVSVEIASRKRICHRNRKDHTIHGGQACLVVREESGGKRNYCAVCAKEIVACARRRLSECEGQLASH